MDTFWNIHTRVGYLPYGEMDRDELRSLADYVLSEQRYKIMEAIASDGRPRVVKLISRNIANPEDYHIQELWMTPLLNFEDAQVGEYVYAGNSRSIQHLLVTGELFLLKHNRYKSGREVPIWQRER